MEYVVDRIQAIALLNQDKIKKFIAFTKKEFNLDPSDFNPGEESEYIKAVLRQYQAANRPSVSSRIKRNRLVQDITELNLACGVSGQSYDGVVPGKSNGMKANNVEIKLTKLLELRETLKKEIANSKIIEECQERKNQMLLEFLNILPNQTHRDIVECTYILCMSIEDISNQKIYGYNTIKTYNNRAINTLAKMVAVVKEKNNHENK